MPHTIHDYSSLQADIKLWTARSDADFVAALPEFIHMAEQRIFYGSKEPFPSDPIRVVDMQRTDDIDVENGIGTLPDNYLSQIAASWNSDVSRQLRFLPPNEFAKTLLEGDIPTYYSISDGLIRVLGAATGSISLTYYEKYANLVEDNDTNWILLNAPSVYLKGSLIEAFGFTRNTGSRQMAHEDFIAATEGLTESTRQVMDGATMAPIIPDTNIVC